MYRFLLLWLCLTSGVLGAQELTLSEEINLNSDISYEVIGELGNHVLLFRNSKISFSVQAFNTQMRESWTKEIVLDKRLPTVLGIVATPVDFSLVYTYRNKGNTVVKVHRYDPAANLIDSMELVNLGYLFFTPRYELIRSEDRSKLLLYYAENQDIIRGYAFDLPTQSKLWEKAFIPQDFIYQRDFLQATIDNRGQANFILQRDNVRSRRKQHYYEIYTYDGAGEVIAKNIAMDKMTYDVFFEPDNRNNQLIAAGLYSEENIDRADGFFYFRYQPRSMEEPQPTFTMFQENFLKNLLGKAYRPGRGLPETDIRDLVHRRDGGTLLIAERNRLIQRRTGMTNRAFMDPTALNMIDFYFEEVFVMSIHPTGELHWETILHKRQYSQDDNGIFSSFFMFETPGRLRFLFNDEIRNESTVSEYLINGLGEYNRNSLFNTTGLDLRLRFRNSTQINSNTLIIPSERKNRLKLVRLTY